MIFSETACGLTLPSDKKRLPTLPCSSRFANVCVFRPFPFLPVSYPIVTDTKRAPAPGQLPYAAMINSVHVPYRQISEDQKTQYAQNDGQCHEKTGYTVEEPEESPETDDGHGSPYRRYTVGIEPAEYDGCCYGQRECPCPSAVRYLSDTFFCFHNLHVFGGNAIPGFRGFLAVRLHRQGFREKYRSLWRG